MESILTVGDISRQCCAPIWAVRRVLDKHFKDSITRILDKRIVPAKLLPAIRRQLEAGGYVKSESARPIA